MRKTPRVVVKLSEGIDTILLRSEPIIRFIVYKTGSRWALGSQDEEDLLQVGRMAVCEAVSRFDDTKGADLLSWIYTVVRCRVMNASKRVTRWTSAHVCFSDMGLPETPDEGWEASLSLGTGTRSGGSSLGRRTTLFQQREPDNRLSDLREQIDVRIENEKEKVALGLLLAGNTVEEISRKMGFVGKNPRGSVYYLIKRAAKSLDRNLALGK